MARKHDGGFAISTYQEGHVDDNARERFGPSYGDPEDRAKMMRTGLVDAEGGITSKGWDLLNKDISQLEHNALKWLKDTFDGARDDGHDRYDDLVGGFWFDLDKPHQVEMLDVGLDERIDMSDSSYGDLANVVWKGVSEFGESVLGGAIHFFDISDDVKEEISDLAFELQKKRRRR